MKNQRSLQVLLALFLAGLFSSSRLFSIAEAINPMVLNLPTSNLFVPAKSSGGKLSVSQFPLMRSKRNNLPLQRLEDAKALVSAGAQLRKDCAVAGDGRVNCIVSHGPSSEVLGFFELERSDSWARPFLHEQDAADVQKVQTIVRGWSKGARKAFDECDLAYSDRVAERNKRFVANNYTFYDQEFALSALYHMALREIAPSKAIYALHHSREEYAEAGTIRNLWAVRRYKDPETNTQVLVWRATLDKSAVVIAVANNNNDFVEPPCSSTEVLQLYQKSKKLKELFYAQENNDETKSVEDTQATAQEVSRSAPPEPEGLDDEDDDENIKISEECYRATRKNFEKQSTKELQKSKKTHEELIQEHLAKLKAYQQNPDAQDHKGLLRNADTEAKRNAIFNGRQNELRSQIRSQRMRRRVICDILKDRGAV